MGGSSRGRAALGCRANLSFAAFFYTWRDFEVDSCCTSVLYRAQAGEQMSCSLLLYSGLPPNFRRQSVTADPWPAGGVGRLGDSLLNSPCRLYSSVPIHGRGKTLGLPACFKFDKRV